MNFPNPFWKQCSAHIYRFFDIRADVLTLQIRYAPDDTIPADAATAEGAAALSVF
jgi:hypothetical protein